MSTGKSNSSHHIRTRLTRLGRDPSQQHGFVNGPIYRGSTVLYPTLEELRTRRQKYLYGTRGTPTTDNLETAWSEISGAEGTVIVPSGLMAIAVALQSCLNAGDHLLVPDSVYRPCRVFCDGFLTRFGVETTYYDPMIGAGIKALIRKNTKAVFTEAPGSQTFEVQDIPAIAEVAHAAGCLVLMDNTWATPLYFPPHDMGVDIAIEAGTKYLGGHSDLLMGLVSANKKAWPALRATYDIMAPCPGPEDVFLALRGMRSMKLRLDEANKQGMIMADWFKSRPEVKTVLHPAFPECPGHEFWKRDFTGASGLFSVVLHQVSEQALARFLDGLEIFGMGFSWGGFESLVTPFDATDYRTATRFDQNGTYLRFQIGLEDCDDLKADLSAAFARLTQGD